MSYSKASKRAKELLKIRHRLCERPSEERRRRGGGLCVRESESEREREREKYNVQRERERVGECV